MYDYGARFYMPDIGRWGVVDPRSQYTHEVYSYVWNNPINFWDPTGMEGEEAKSTNGSGGGVIGTDKNPIEIDEVKITAKAKSSTSNNGNKVQLAGVKSTFAFTAAIPGLIKAIEIIIASYITYKAAESTKNAYDAYTEQNRRNYDDTSASVIDIEGVIVPGPPKAVDDTEYNKPVNVLGERKVDFAQRGKGERGFAGKTSGTDNPYKHVKPDTKKQVMLFTNILKVGKKFLNLLHLAKKSILDLNN